MRSSLKVWFGRTVPSEFSLSQAKPPRVQVIEMSTGSKGL
jgi:hypothetical protein